MFRESLEHGALALRRIPLGRGAYVRAAVGAAHGRRQGARLRGGVRDRAGWDGCGGCRVRRRPRRHRVALRVAAHPGGEPDGDHEAGDACCHPAMAPVVPVRLRPPHRRDAVRFPQPGVAAARSKRTADTVRRVGAFEHPGCARSLGAGEGVRQGSLRSGSCRPRRATLDRGRLERRPPRRGARRRRAGRLRGRRALGRGSTA